MLNSSFANLPFAIAEAGEPGLEMHPADAAARGIANGDTVRVFNDRGSLKARARVGERAREGVVVALSVWWKKLTPDGCNANDVTSQALSDSGNSADAAKFAAKAAKFNQLSFNYAYVHSKPDKTGTQAAN